MIFRDKSASELRMLCRWCPAYRWHESVLGSSMELREPVAWMLRDTPKWLKPQGIEYRCHALGRSCSYDYMDVIGRQCRSTLSSSDEASVMEVEQRGSVGWFSIRINGIIGILSGCLFLRCSQQPDRTGGILSENRVTFIWDQCSRLFCKVASFLSN